jgi:hypothetical protein
MKKLIILLLIFISTLSVSFANFTVETKLSTSKQEAFKTWIDRVFTNFEENLFRLSYDEQIDSLNTIISNIDTILLKEKKDANIYVFTYLRYLLQEKLEFLSIANLWELLALGGAGKEIPQNQAPVIIYVPENNTQAQTCVIGYHLEWNTCVSNTRNLNISNWSGYQAWTGTNWAEPVISCNNWYSRSWNNCVANQVTCDIANWSGMKTWNWGSYWECKLSICTEWYAVVGSSCQKIEMLATSNAINNTIFTKWISDALVSSVYISTNHYIRISGAQYVFNWNNDSYYNNAFATLYVNGNAVSTQTIRPTTETLRFTGFSQTINSSNPINLEVRISFTENVLWDFEIKLIDISSVDNIFGNKIIPESFPIVNNFSIE